MVKLVRKYQHGGVIVASSLYSLISAGKIALACLVIMNASHNLFDWVTGGTPTANFFSPLSLKSWKLTWSSLTCNNHVGSSRLPEGKLTWTSSRLSCTSNFVFVSSTSKASTSKASYFCQTLSWHLPPFSPCTHLLSFSQGLWCCYIVTECSTPLGKPSDHCFDTQTQSFLFPLSE